MFGQALSVGQVTAINAKNAAKTQELLASTAIDDFLAEYRGVVGRSQRATDSQRANLHDTLKLIGEVRGEAPDEVRLADVSREDLVASLLLYRERPDPRFTSNPDKAPRERSNESMARRVSAIRTFMGWCGRTERIYVDPSLTLKSPRRQANSPEALSEEEARRVLVAASTGAWPLRDVALVSLALGCGPRLAEMVNATLSDLNGSPPEPLTVMGKGSKPRRLHLGSVPSQATAAWLVERQAFLDKHHLTSDRLFLATRPRQVVHATGRPVWECGLNRDGVAGVFDAAVTTAGLRKPGVRTHVCRHTFATLALRSKTFDLRLLQAALGHANLATMSRYLHVNDEDLAKAASSHPLSK